MSDATIVNISHKTAGLSHGKVGAQRKKVLQFMVKKKSPNFYIIMHPV